MKTPFVRGLGLQRRFNAIRRDDLAVFGFQNVRVQSVSPGDLDPALAEFAGRAHDDLVAARE